MSNTCYPSTKAGLTFRRTFSVFLLFGLMTTAQALADDEGGSLPRVRGMNWGSTLAADGSGFYNDVINEIRTMGPDFHYEVGGYRRSLRDMLRGAINCMYPFEMNTLEYGNEVNRTRIIESSAIISAHTFAVSSTKEGIAHSLKDLEKGLIIQQLGEKYNAVKDFAHLRFLTVADEDVAINALLGGRAPYLFGSAPDFMMIAKKRGAALYFDPKFPVFSINIRIMCQKTTRNERFIQALNKTIESEQFKRKVEELLASYGVKPKDIPLFRPNTVIAPYPMLHKHDTHPK